VTNPGRTPSWDEIEQFCKIDGWVSVRTSDHEHWEKVLPSGRVLRTHTSYAGGKTMSQGRFASILRTQLQVSRSDFWNALQTGRPVERPSESDEPAPPSHEAYVVLGLKKYGLTEEEIARLSIEEAIVLLREKWAGQ